MKRLIYLAALSGALASTAACGEELDTRPATTEYVVTTILAPTCGRAGCHSAQTAWEGLAFDTIDGTYDALEQGASAVIADVIFDGEMPPEGPLSDKDTALVLRWLERWEDGR